MHAPISLNARNIPNRGLWHAREPSSNNPIDLLLVIKSNHLPVEQSGLFLGGEVGLER